MSIKSRAFKYLTRKTSRSIIMFLLMTLITITLFSSISIHSSVKSLKHSLQYNTNSSFSIESTNGSIAIQDLQFLQNEDIKAKVAKTNYQLEGFASLKEMQVVSTENGVILDEDINAGTTNVLRVSAVQRSNDHRSFIAESFKLVSGRHLNENDQNKILVHEEFAKLNNLKLGDKVKLSKAEFNQEQMYPERNENDGVELYTNEKTQESNQQNNLHHKSKTTQNMTTEPIDYEIVGIFTGETLENFTGTSADISQNHVFTDFHSAQSLSAHESNEKEGDAKSSERASTVRVFAKDAAELDSLYAKVQEALKDNKNVKLVKDANSVSDVLDSIAVVEQIVLIMSLAIFFGGILVLSLLLLLWLRERIHEVAILLSVGKSKSEIIYQFLLELFVLSIPTIIISTLLSAFTTQWMWKAFIADEVSASESIMNAGLGNNLWLNTLITYGVLCLIVVIAVLISSFFILKKKPRELLDEII